MSPRSAQQRGFTLVELIVASAVFAMVSLVAFGVLSSAHRIRRETAALRSLAEAAQFSFEAVSREAHRGAIGIFSDSGTRTVGLSGMVEGVQLGIAEYAPDGNLGETRYIRRVVGDDGHAFLALETRSAPDPERFGFQEVTQVPLTPGSVEVDTVEFRGVDHYMVPDSEVMPYVELTMVLRPTDLAEGVNTELRQTVQSVIAVRRYR